MGNKSSILPKGPDPGSAREDEVVSAITGQSQVHPDERRTQEPQRMLIHLYQTRNVSLVKKYWQKDWKKKLTAIQ